MSTTSVSIEGTVYEFRLIPNSNSAPPDLEVIKQGSRICIIGAIQEGPAHMSGIRSVRMKTTLADIPPDLKRALLNQAKGVYDTKYPKLTFVITSFL